MSDRHGGFDDQLQGEDDQPQADAHAPELSGAGLLAREEEDHSQKDQQRRQPGQVEGQYPGHQRGADVGAEHGCQGWSQRHQALADKGRHQHRRGVATLDHGCDQDTGDKGQRASGHVLADHLAQVGAVDPQDTGPDDMRTPDQQGHGGKQIEQGQHGGPPGIALAKKGQCRFTARLSTTCP